jgi:hypothetical protein
MAKNIIYVFIIFLILICEISAQVIERQQHTAFWANNFRTLSFIMMGVWCFHKQKGNFRTIQRLFLISILLPIFAPLAFYFYAQPKAIFISIGIDIIFFCLWIIVFKKMGAKISLKESSDTIKKLFPVLFILPFIYYFIILYPILPYLYAIIVFIYILLLSYVCILSIFLPINEEYKEWIILGLILFFFLSFMNGHHEFLQQTPWSYPAIRILAVISRCMIIYGMINYKVVSKVNSTEKD